MEAPVADTNSYTHGTVNANLNKFIVSLFDNLRYKNADKRRSIMKDVDFSRIFRGTDMEIYGNRLQTFIVGEWNKLVSMSELSTAGFCFTGNEDKVVCFSCKGVLSSWKAGDMPIMRHFRAFRHCKFAKMIWQKNKPTSKLAFDNVRVTASPVYDDEKFLEGEFETISFFNSEYNRLLSLVGWSIDHAFNVKEVAKAGFFQDIDSSDIVKCFSCFVKIDGSQSGKEPMEVHRRKSPKCPFVNGLETANKPITNDELRQADRLFQQYAKQSRLTSPFQCTESPFETGVEKQPEKETKETSFNDDPMYLTAQYKKYFAETKRMESFSNWPKDHFLKPVVFVKAGFFKSGKEDQVTCFYCGLNLLDWEQEDDPLEEHKREAPGCKWLLFQTSRQRVKKTILQEQRVVEKVSLQEAKELERKDFFSVSAVIDLEELIDSEITKDIVNMGFSEEIINHVYRQRLESGEQQPLFQDAEDLLQAIFEEEEKRKQEKVKNQKSVNLPIQNGVQDRKTMNALEQKIEKLEERNTCKICLDEEVSIIFLPCKHLAVCDGCAERVETCPFCREYIDDKLQVYIP